MRFSIKCIFLGLCYFLIATVRVHAQPLNLYDAVTKAQTVYPLIQQREAEVAASRAHVTTVGNYRLPSLKLVEEATAGTANSIPGSYFTLGTIPSVSGSVRSANNNSLSSGNIGIAYLDWPVYTFGYYNAQRREATAQLNTSRAYLEGDKYLLTQNIISIYLDWLKKYRLLKIEHENVQRTAYILNAIKATVNSGLKPGVDSATAGAEFARARIAYLQAVNDYKYGQVYLSSITGIDTTGLVPDTSIFTSAFLSRIALIQPSDSLNSPILDIYQKMYEQQQANNATIAKKYLPRLSLESAAWARGSSISYKDQYAADALDATANSRYNYLFGVALSYNIADIKHRRDELAENRYRTTAAKQALQNQQLQYNRILQQTIISYNTTQQKLLELPARLQSAREAYNQQTALYQSGLNTLTEVTNALYVLNQAETEIILAQDDLLQLSYTRAGLNNQLPLFLEQFKK